ncbi:MAG: glycosyltransferase [Gemmataceae bacterium]
MPAIAVRPLAASDLSPGPGLAPVGDKWAVDAPHVRLTADAELLPGWYEVRLAVASADKFNLRKRLELTFDPADANPRPPAREAFAWNRSFAERFVLQLTRPARGVRLDVWHAEGTVTLDQFRVRPVSTPVALARAVREKVRLTRAYRCFGPAMIRGGRMLVRGKFREFGRKLYKGLTDARVMQLGAVYASEVDGAWWRRNTLPADEVERVRQAVDAMTDPPPLAVLIPACPATVDMALLSAHAVRRQIYPHWQLLIAHSGPSDQAAGLARIFRADPRVTVVRVPGWAGRPAAMAKAITQAECDRVAVVAPGVELAEHALYHFAEAVKADPAVDALGGRVAAGVGEDEEAAAARPGSRVWLIRTKKLSDPAPKDVDPAAMAVWATSEVPAVDRVALSPVLAYPTDDRPLLDRTRVGAAPKASGKRLTLSADIRGIGGYDHVAFAFLKGLGAAGIDLRMHHGAAVRTDLIPPNLLRKHAKRQPGDPQLVVDPPFLVPRFNLDKASAVYTMWETDTLQPDWARQINRAAVVIVPSRWQVECFRKSGVTVPIEVAPLGFDPLLFHPVGPPPAVCTFGTAGALTAGGVRKNAQWVIDLFRQAFPDEQDVRLRVKITPGSPGVETYDDPRIDVLRAVLPHTELADWYRSLTAYVNGSSGEGFGLHLIEAMACGRPLITPCHSGLTAFFDPSVGYPVDYTLVPVRGSDTYTGTWAEPSGASLVERMRQVYADPATAARFGAASAARAKLFTWKAAGQQLLTALRKHGFVD